MNVLVARFRNTIKGIITGFDRIVFKGSILPLAYAAGAMRFCWAHGIRNKDFKRWAMEQTGVVMDSAQRYAVNHGGRGIQPIVYSKTRKEALAHTCLWWSRSAAGGGLDVQHPLGSLCSYGSRFSRWP